MRIKFILILLFSALLATNSFSQNVISSRQTSEMTYIFKLDQNQVEYFYKKSDKKLKKEILINLVDSFPTDSKFSKKLDVGYYAFVHTEGNRMVYNIQTISDIYVFSMQNDRDIIIKIQNKKGEVIDDAKVWIKNKRIKFDKKTNSYLFPKGKKKGLVKIEIDKKTYYYSISKERDYYYSYRYRHRRHILRNLFSKKDRKQYDANSYIVFNKPKYKPNDTVKFKAFISDKKGNFYAEQVEVWLSDYYYTKGKKITDLKPYRQGGYSYEFVLEDSLDLKVDRTYYIFLKNSKGEDIKTGSFYHEDYELQNMELTLRTNNGSEHYEDVPFLLYIQATDNNRMNLPGAKAEIKILLSYTNSFFKSYSVIPYTIWETTKNLENVGETSLKIPDTLFNKIDLSYNIFVTVQTPDYEELSSSKAITFYKKKKELKANVKNDSVHFTFTENGKEISKQGKLTIYYGAKKEEKQVSLPHKEKIDINATSYYFMTDGETFSQSASNLKHGMYIDGQRTKDSIKIQINNPNHIPVQYQIYYGDKEITRGNSSKDFVFAEKSKNKKLYTIKTQFIWANSEHSDSETFDLYENTLNIELESPDKVYPGEKADFKIKVTDYKGEKVENTDLTAYSYTSKFNEGSPDIPDYNEYKEGTKTRKNYEIDELGFNNRNEKIDYEKWQRLFKLDKEEYYKFLNTDSVYKNAVEIGDSTQFAPFVFIDGEFQPISYILIDGIPVYFGWSNTQPYSINVDWKYAHTIFIRTNNRLIKFHKYQFEEGKKNILAVNAKNLTPEISYSYEESMGIEKMKKKLKKTEKYVIYRYMMYAHSGYSYYSSKDMKYLEQDGNYYNINNYNLVPFKQSKITYKKIDGKSYRFNYEQNYSYEFQDLKIKMRELDKKDYPRKTLKSYPKSNLNSLTYNEKNLNDEWKHTIEQKRKNLGFDKYYYGNTEIRFDFYDEKPIDITNIILLNTDENWFSLMPNYIRSKKIRKGNYKMILLMEDKTVKCIDDIKLDSNTISFYRINLPEKNFYNEEFDTINLILDSMAVRYLWQSKENFVKINEYLGNIDFNNSNSVFDCLIDENSDLENLYKIEKIVTAKVVEWGEDFEVGKTIKGYAIGTNGEYYASNTKIECLGSEVKTLTNENGYFEIKPPANCTKLKITDASGYWNIIEFSKTGLEIHLLNSTNFSHDLNPNYVYTVSQSKKTGINIGGKKKFKKSRYNAKPKFGAFAAPTNQNVFYSGEPNEAKVFAAAYDTVASTNLNISRVSVAPGASSKFVIRGFYYEVSETDFGNAANELDPSDPNIGYFIDGKILNYEELFNKYPGLDTMNFELGNPQFGDKKWYIIVEVLFIQDDSFQLEMSQNSIRDNFSDYAFWKPQLLTDENGEVEFSATFPDDITKWDVNVIGIAPNRLSGFEQTAIKSYKAVMSQLAIPRFLVEGDSVNVIGKTTNYTSDTLNITTNFVLNDSPIWFKKHKLLEPIIDTMFLTATRQDSMKIKYFLETETGYVDGEERKIPINRKGTEIANGHFFVLDKKEQEIEIKTDTMQANFTISAVTNELDIFLYESQRVQSYKHYCNEQLASKLYAFLAEKTIKEFQGEKFKKERQVKRIIRKLEKNANSDGLWGWWKKSETSYWITMHVVNALLKAEEAGYKISVGFENVGSELMWQYPKLSQYAQLYVLETLQKLNNQQVNYEAELDKFDYSKFSVTGYFRSVLIRQNAGIETSLDSVMDYKKESLYGNIYFSAGIRDYFVYSNDVLMTLYGYKILKNQGNNDEKLAKIRNYLLEQRQLCWRNTYEIAMIIETVLPDFMDKKTTFESAELLVNNKKVVEFPFELEIDDVEKIKFKKSGDAPVYLAVYEQQWITKPNKNSKYFDIKTSFSQGDTLRAGEKVELKVDLLVKKRAEYVMVEIPIPAGCSYKNKEESYYAAHTEFYKDKVIMYFNALEAREYQFTINLQPRYTGKYTLNPAKAELMYLPVFYGNNEIREVFINEK